MAQANCQAKDVPQAGEPSARGFPRVSSISNRLSIGFAFNLGICVPRTLAAIAIAAASSPLPHRPNRSIGTPVLPVAAVTRPDYDQTL
jgi:hypothetical protein